MLRDEDLLHLIGMISGHRNIKKEKISRHKAGEVTPSLSQMQPPHVYLYTDSY